MSEPELATIGGDLSQPSNGLISSDSGYQTLPTRGKPGFYQYGLCRSFSLLGFSGHGLYYQIIILILLD